MKTHRPSETSGEERPPGHLLLPDWRDGEEQSLTSHVSGRIGAELGAPGGTRGPATEGGGGEGLPGPHSDGPGNSPSAPARGEHRKLF